MENKQFSIIFEFNFDNLQMRKDSEDKDLISLILKNLQNINITNIKILHGIRELIMNSEQEKEIEKYLKQANFDSIFQTFLSNSRFNGPKMDILSFYKQKVDEKDLSIIRENSFTNEKILKKELGNINFYLGDKKTSKSSPNLFKQGEFYSSTKINKANSSILAYSNSNSSNIKRFLLVEKFKHIYDEALLSTKTKKYIKSSYKIYVLFGNMFYTMEYYDQAEIFYESALEVLSKTEDYFPEYQLQLSIIYNNFGLSLIKNLKINQGIEKIKMSINLAKGLMNNNILFTKIHLAYALYYNHQYKLSFSFLEEVANYLNSNDIINFDYSIMNAKVYNLMGLLFVRNENYELGLTYLNKSLMIIKEIYEGKGTYTAQLYNNISLAYIGKNQLEEALKYAELSLLNFKEIYGESHYRVAIVLKNISYIHQIRKEFTKSLESIINSLKISNSSLNSSHIINGVINRSVGSCFFEFGNEMEVIRYCQKANQIYKYHIDKLKSHVTVLNGILVNVLGVWTI